MNVEISRCAKLHQITFPKRHNMLMFCSVILRILQLFIFSVNFRECALKIALTRSNFQPKMLAGVKGPTSKGRGGEGGEIFLSSFWGPPDPHRGSALCPDLPLLFKLHDICLVDSQENH